MPKKRRPPGSPDGYLAGCGCMLAVTTGWVILLGWIVHEALLWALS